MGSKPRKWQIVRLIGGNNEQIGLEWWRHGIAALGEPARVTRIEYYPSYEVRHEIILSCGPPLFAI